MTMDCWSVMHGTVFSHAYMQTMCLIIQLIFFVAKKTLQDLKQLFFQLKDDVFATAKMGDYGCDSKKFSEVFKEYFGEEIRMHSVSEPKLVNI